MENKTAFWDRLLLCFFLGSLGGTLLMNLWRPDTAGLLDSASHRALEFWSGKSLSQQENLLFYITRQRFGRTLLLFLMAVTAWARPWFYFSAFYGGLSGAVLLSALTFQKGWLGLGCYLVLLLPHYALYLLVWFILAGWAFEQSHKVRFREAIGIALLTGAGVFLEVFANPILLKLCF